MIGIYGTVTVTNALLEAAEQVKHLNYKVTHPKHFAKTQGTEELAGTMIEQLRNKAFLESDNINWVLFSAASGAEEHTDVLPTNFDDITYVIPLIVPYGGAVLHAEDACTEIEPFMVYSFDHTKPHSLSVLNEKEGCVLIMATETF